MQLMKGFPVRPIPVENVGVAAKAVARRQAEQLTLVRRRAQPTAVYIARLTVTAVFAYLLALQLPGGSPRSVLAPLTALLVVQATLFNTIGTAIRRVAAVTVGVLSWRPFRARVVGEGHELAGVGVDPGDGHARVARGVLLGDRERDRPEGPAVEPLAHEPHLRALRAEIGGARRRRDRGLLRDPDLMALAAGGGDQAQREQAHHEDGRPNPGRKAPGGAGGARRSGGTRCQYWSRG